MRGFTFLELTIVLIIIGILATLGITQYGSYRERSLGREAIAHLRLIAAAEKVYRLEIGHYYPNLGEESNVNNINAYLKLTLSERNWDDRVDGGADGSSFTAYATRGGCEYSMGPNDEEPVPNANCP